MTRKIKSLVPAYFLCCLSLISKDSSGQDYKDSLDWVNRLIDASQKSTQESLVNYNWEPTLKNDIGRFSLRATDSLQNAIMSDPALTDQEKLKALKSHLYFTDAFRNAVRNKIFEPYNIRGMALQYLAISDRIRHQQPYHELMADLGPERLRLIATAFRDYPQYKDLRDLTVIRHAQFYPGRIQGYLQKNPDYSYMDSLIFIWANRDPVSFTDYISKQRQEPLFDRIKIHPSPLVQQLADMASRPTRKNYLPFTVSLMNGKVTYEELDKMRAEPEKFYTSIVDAQMSVLQARQDGSRVYYAIPTRAYLKYYAQKFYVNPLNALHESTNDKRFAMLKGLRTEDLYYIIVNGEDVLYTSSYLYLFEKVTAPYKTVGYDSLLRYMKFDQSRKFIRLAGRYNTLGPFLKNMNPDTMQGIIGRMMSGLEQRPEEGMEEIMDIAETFPVFAADPALSRLMEEDIQDNLARVQKERNFFGIKAYSLLNELYKAFLATGANESLSLPPSLQAYLQLPHKVLPDEQGRVNQVVFFYGDDDGKGSYQSFLKNFKDSAQWRSESNENWIAIHSKKGFPTSIYANLPLSNDEDLDRQAQDLMLAFMEQNQIKAHILIHRGHSYHLSNSVRHVNPDIQLAILGSCGGYREIFTVQEKSKDAQVISTKQVGSMLVNEPMLRMINGYVLDEKDIVWASMWADLEKEMKKNKQAYKYFADYVPPNKNIGLLVARLFHDDGDFHPTDSDVLN